MQLPEPHHKKPPTIHTPHPSKSNRPIPTRQRHHHRNHTTRRTKRHILARKRNNDYRTERRRNNRNYDTHPQLPWHIYQDMANASNKTRHTNACTNQTANTRARLRQIGILAKLRIECNTTTKQHPEITDDSDLNPLHINLKRN